MLKDSPGIKEVLSPIEKKIYDSRLDGYSFSQLEDEDRKWAIDQIMIRGAAISGCALPNTDFFAEKIGEEITIFISEYGYGDFSLSEILTALRMNAKGGLRFPSGTEIEQVQFSGVCINVDFISKVLHNYMVLRNNLDRLFQNEIDGYNK